MRTIRYDPFDITSNGFWIISTAPFVHVQACYGLQVDNFLFSRVSCFLDQFKYGSVLLTNL
jgi:hypothetical protein